MVITRIICSSQGLLQFLDCNILKLYLSFCVFLWIIYLVPQWRTVHEYASYQWFGSACFLRMWLALNWLLPFFASALWLGLQVFLVYEYIPGQYIFWCISFSVHAFYLLLRWQRLHIHLGFRIKFWGGLLTNLWVIVRDKAVLSRLSFLKPVGYILRLCNS